METALKRFLNFPEAREGAELLHSKLEDWRDWNVLVLAPSSVIFHFASAQIVHSAVVSGNWSRGVGEGSCKRPVAGRLNGAACKASGGSRCADRRAVHPPLPSLTL